MNSGWQQRLKQLIPSYGESLIDNAQLLEQVRSHTLHTLGLRPADESEQPIAM